MQRHLVFVDKITWWFLQKEKKKKSQFKELQTTQIIYTIYPRRTPLWISFISCIMFIK